MSRGGSGAPVHYEQTVRSCLLADGLVPVHVAQDAIEQGLTFVHFSAQLEPRLTQNDTLHTLTTP